MLVDRQRDGLAEGAVRLAVRRNRLYVAAGLEPGPVPEVQVKAVSVRIRLEVHPGALGQSFFLLDEPGVEVAVQLIADDEVDDDRRREDRERNGGRRDQSQPGAKGHCSRRA